MSQDQNPTAHLSVVGGNPTPEELAVVIAVVQAAAASAAANSASRPSQAASSWSQNSGRLRGPIVPGHNQWRASYRSGLN